ncbi:MAG: CoA pyrophosphatase [Pseudomonadales bacterium]
MSYSKDWLAILENALQKQAFSFTTEMEAINFRQAAVLILFWDDGGQPATLVTVRAATMPTHAGEVSFPGGGLHPGEDHISAALREAEEEVGLDRSSVRVLGRLDDAWSGAGFSLAPIVAYSDIEPTFRTSREVERVITMNLHTEAEFLERTITKFNSEHVEPIIRAKGIEVVGLTADLLTEALEALRGERSNRGERRFHYFKKFAKPRKISS